MTAALNASPPRHRHEMTLHLGANTIDDLCDEMRRIADELEREGRDEAREIASSAGYRLVIDHDPTMTPERYDAELKAWADARHAVRMVAQTQTEVRGL